MLYFYIGCLSFGLIYSIVSLFIGHDGNSGHVGHSGLDHSAQNGHEQGDSPSIFNPLVIASAITAFGAAGTATTSGLGLTLLPSLFISLITAGLIGAGIFYGIVKVMYRSQSDSTFSMADIPGCEVEVITPVPEKGVGEVVFSIMGERHNFPAKSLFGESFVRGELAIVHKVESGIIQLVKLHSKNVENTINFETDEVQRSMKTREKIK